MGVRQPDQVERVLATVSRDDIGAMPYYMAEQTALVVKRGLALYQILFATPSDRASR